MVRPIQVDSTLKYACPKGYVACNPDFFLQPQGADYVVCKESDSFNEADCPITSVKFSVTKAEREKFDYKFRGATGTKMGVWISRKVM